MFGATRLFQGTTAINAQPFNPLRRQAKQSRSQTTVDAILEAAAQVLTINGYAASSTNRIAEAAGVSVGTLYQYFSNKDDVFDAVICRMRDRVLAALEGQTLDPCAPLRSKLRQVFSVVIIAMPHGPELLRGLEYVPNALLQQRIAEGRQKFVSFIREMLEAHRCELRPTDLDLAAFLLVAASEGAGADAASEIWGERLADELTELFSRYLLKSPE